MHVWRTAGTALNSGLTNNTVKFGRGSIMVWGCISYQGQGKLIFVDTLMNAEAYVNIIREHLIDSELFSNHLRPILQQDNDPKHTSKRARDFFVINNISVLLWPAQSPDLNII